MPGHQRELERSDLRSDASRNDLAQETDESLQIQHSV